MQQKNSKPPVIKPQFSTPLYSPRSTYSNHLKQLQHLKTSMIINIDKYILGNLKTQFQKRNKELSMLEFIHFSKKFLKDWNSELSGREVKMKECLVDVWREIDVEGRGKITWEQFNSKIIQTSLNLKTLSSNAGLHAPSFRQFGVHLNPGKCQSPIQKIVYLGRKNKMAFFREQSTYIQFFPTETQPNTKQSPPQTKPILLPQQQLKVQTMIKVKQKNQPQPGTVQKSTRVSKMVKKDIKVSTYKNTVLDAIYLQDQKYDMLMVSCSDKYVRGYNISNVLPAIAYQPQNQDQLMVHQFPFQIYTMAWDPVHQVLYGAGKYATIYEWLAKTDSERQMFDTRGHDGMISTMLMMPKLQLLATGGYDGRLLLWDTVGQAVKSRYQQHTRAISSITFHQQLVLLFTSGLDHKICVWNPYISSLIHKIDNTLNIIHLQIIPQTSYLLSLDQGGTVKLREVNRFSQITTFSIFRSQEQSEQINSSSKLASGDKEKQFIISMCSKKDGNIHYYFGTDKIAGYQFVEVEKNTINNHTGVFATMKYCSKNLKLYTPLKNHIQLWNLLTGKNENTFYDLTENDITNVEILQDSNFIIIADTDGNITQKKINNGHLIKNIIKMKTSINNLKLYQLERNQKEKNTKKTYYLFSTTEQGEIAIMKCHPKGDFQIHRHFSLKQDFSIINPHILEIQFFIQKHILIIWMASNEIVTIDVEKKTLLTKIQFSDQLIAGINVITGQENGHFLSIVTKSSQISGFYLPPHSKKFKPSCNINLQGINQLQCSVYGPKSHIYFVSTQMNELYSFKLDKRLLDVESETTALKRIWRTKLQNRVSEMLLIENQEILILLNQSDDFIIVSTSTGKIICHLKNQKTKLITKQEIQPILYMNEKTSKILIPNQQKIIKLFEDQLQPQKKTVQKVINPNYFINYLISKDIIDFSKVSNPSWDLNLNLIPRVDKRTQEIQLIEDKLKQYSNVFDKPGLIQIQKRIQIAKQLQNKWEKEKQKEKEQETNQEADLTKNFNSLQRKSTSRFDPKAFDNAMKKKSRGSSLSSLYRHQQNKKKLQEFSVHVDRKLHLQQKNDPPINTKYKNIDLIQQADLLRLQKDPLFRLGLALKSLNNKDQKAENLMQLAKKKDQVKLPKISSQKMKL